MPTFDLSGVQTLVLQVLGTCAICYVAVMLFVYWVQSGWGRMVTLLAGGAFVFWFVWFPESATTALKGIVSAVTPA